MLRCSDNSLYTGLTTDPARRLSEHQSGGTKGARYTRARLPVSLVWQSESLPDRSSASSLEYQIKRMTRKQKLQLISRSES